MCPSELYPLSTKPSAWAQPRSTCWRRRCYMCGVVISSSVLLRCACPQSISGWKARRRADSLGMVRANLSYIDRWPGSSRKYSARDLGLDVELNRLHDSINSRKRFREARARRPRMDLREGGRCDFSEVVEARARLRDKANTNQLNLLCQAPPPPGSLTPSQGEGDMDTTSENQTATVRDQERWPMRVIRRGEAVRPLPPHARSLEDLTFEVGDVRRSLSDYMARRRTAGLLILKGGEIALERYGMGSNPECLQTSYSTAKSITSTLVGAALHDGAIGSLDDRCDLYLPRLRGSAYEGVTIRNVLRMCSGVAWSELDDGQADGGRLQQALASRRPGSILELACSLSRAHPQGAPSSTIRPSIAACLLRCLRPPRAVRWPTTAPRRSGGLPAWRPMGTGCSSPRAVWSGVGLASARACATSAVSANWCWRTARRSVAEGSCRPAGAISPASPTARPPPSVA